MGRPVLQQVIGAFPHGANWATLVKNPSDVPLWVLPNLNRYFCFDMAKGSKALFLSTTANHINLGAPVINGTVSVLRYNLFKQIVVMQCLTTNLGVPEIHTALPLLLPSGRYHVPGLIFRVQQWRNQIEWNVQIKLRPDLLKTMPEPTVASSSSREESPKELKESKESKETKEAREASTNTVSSGNASEPAIVQSSHQAEASQLDELSKYLEITAYAGDGVWNHAQYYSDAITHFHLTALAEFVIVEPNDECLFDFLPQKSDGTPLPLFNTSAQATPVAPTPPRFNGITQLPQGFNPCMHANIHSTQIMRSCTIQ